jgi:hypothetical protein
VKGAIVAEPGTAFNQTFVSIGTVDEVMQTFLSGTSGTNGYAVATAGNNTLIITRRYIPTWAIVVGIIGILFFFIGALAFLIRNTETLTITLVGSPGGTKVTISGIASNEMAERLSAVITSLQSGPQMPTSSSEVSDMWYVARGAERFGPVSINEVQAWLQDGRASGTDLVWGPGFAEWQPAFNVPALELPPPPPPHS